MWVMTDDPREAPNEPTDITIHFEKGIPTKLVTPQGEHTDSVDLFSTLNKIGKIHGIGRIDIVETRSIGLKSRGCYDSPAMTILRLAHLDLEGLVLDGQVRALRDQFVTPTWSSLLYNGMFRKWSRNVCNFQSLCPNIRPIAQPPLKSRQTLTEW